MTASSFTAEALWSRTREMEAVVQREYAPAAGAPENLRILSFSRRRHIDLQRVTSCLCRPSR
jgi:hypothetical protein